MQADTVSPAARPTSKLIPTLVLIVAFLPIAASVLLYVSGWRPISTVNHGELITPALPLADHALHDVDGKVVKFSDLRGQWVMLYLDAADCPATCMDNLYRMRQTYIALGQFMTSAAVLGIDTCPLEGLEPAGYDEILGLAGSGYATSVACAAGYRSAEDKYASVPKSRFPLEEIIEHR